MAKTNTSLGMNEKLEAALTYLCGWLTGLIFLLAEKKSKLVRFHALQSIVASVVVTIVYFLLGISIIGVFLFPLLGILVFIGWIFCMYKAYQGKMFEIPVIGPFVKKQKL
jgi:uncharacterized membrane protein